VGQIGEQFQTLADDVVVLPAFDMGDEPHAASVMFVARVIQTLLGGYSAVTHFFTSVRHSANGEVPICSVVEGRKFRHFNAETLALSAVADVSLLLNG
jgi:hypothetical protein